MKTQVHFVFYSVTVYMSVFMCFGEGGPGKITLYRGLKKGDVESNKCTGGIYLKTPTIFTCACLTGVWAMYEKYCSKPKVFVGATDYCFHMKNFSISQVIPIGNPTQPFQSTLNIFKKDLSVYESWFNGDAGGINIPTSATFVTVGESAWTIYNGDDSRCLQPMGGDQLCKFHKLHLKKKGWKSISGVRKGCFSKNIVTPKKIDCFAYLSTDDQADCDLERLDEKHNKRIEEDWDDDDNDVFADITKNKKTKPIENSDNITGEQDDKDEEELKASVHNETEGKVNNGNNDKSKEKVKVGNGTDIIPDPSKILTEQYSTKESERGVTNYHYHVHFHFPPNGNSREPHVETEIGVNKTGKVGNDPTQVNPEKAGTTVKPGSSAATTNNSNLSHSKNVKGNATELETNSGGSIKILPGNVNVTTHNATKEKPPARNASSSSDRTEIDGLRKINNETTGSIKLQPQTNNTALHTHRNDELGWMKLKTHKNESKTLNQTVSKSSANATGLTPQNSSKTLNETKTVDANVKTDNTTNWYEISKSNNNASVPSIKVQPGWIKIKMANNSIIFENLESGWIKIKAKTDAPDLHRNKDEWIKINTAITLVTLENAEPGWIKIKSNAKAPASNNNTTETGWVQIETINNSITLDNSKSGWINIKPNADAEPDLIKIKATNNLIILGKSEPGWVKIKSNPEDAASHEKQSGLPTKTKSLNATNYSHQGGIKMKKQPEEAALDDLVELGWIKIKTNSIILDNSEPESIKIKSNDNSSTSIKAATRLIRINTANYSVSLENKEPGWINIKINIKVPVSSNNDHGWIKIKIINNSFTLENSYPGFVKIKSNTDASSFTNDTELGWIKIKTVKNLIILENAEPGWIKIKPKMEQAALNDEESGSSIIKKTLNDTTSIDAKSNGLKTKGPTEESASSDVENGSLEREKANNGTSSFKNDPEPDGSNRMVTTKDNLLNGTERELFKIKPNSSASNGMADPGWIKIKATNNSIIFKNSEPGWIKIKSKSDASSKKKETEWIQIQLKNNSVTMESSGPWLKIKSIAKQSISNDTELGWMQIETVNKSITLDNSEPGWFKIKSKSDASSSSEETGLMKIKTIKNSITLENSEPGWIKIKSNTKDAEDAAVSNEKEHVLSKIKSALYSGPNESKSLAKTEEAFSNATEHELVAIKLNSNSSASNNVVEPGWIKIKTINNSIILENSEPGFIKIESKTGTSSSNKNDTGWIKVETINRSITLENVEPGWIKIKSHPKVSSSNNIEQGWIKFKAINKSFTLENTEPGWIRIKSKTETIPSSATVSKSGWIKIKTNNNNAISLENLEPGWIRIKADTDEAVRVNTEQEMKNNEAKIKNTTSKTFTNDSEFGGFQTNINATNNVEPDWIKIETDNDPIILDSTEKGWIKLKSKSNGAAPNVSEPKGLKSKIETTLSNSTDSGWIKINSTSDSLTLDYSELGWIKLKPKSIKNTLNNTLEPGWIKLKSKFDSFTLDNTELGWIKLKTKNNASISKTTEPKLTPLNSETGQQKLKDTESGWIRLKTGGSSISLDNSESGWIQLKSKYDASEIKDAYNADQHEWNNTKQSANPSNIIEPGWIKLKTKSNYIYLDSTEPEWIKLKSKTDATASNETEPGWIKLKSTSDSILLDDSESGWIKLKTTNDATDLKAPSPGWIKQKSKSNSDTLYNAEQNKTKQKSSTDASNITETGWVKLKCPSNSIYLDGTDPEWVKIRSKSDQNVQLGAESGWIKLKTKQSDSIILDVSESGWFKLRPKTAATDLKVLYPGWIKLKSKINSITIDNTEPDWIGIKQISDETTSNQTDLGWIKIKSISNTITLDNSEYGWIKMKSKTFEATQNKTEEGWNKITMKTSEVVPNKNAKTASKKSEVGWIKIKSKTGNAAPNKLNEAASNKNNKVTLKQNNEAASNKAKEVTSNKTNETASNKSEEGWINIKLKTDETLLNKIDEVLPIQPDEGNLNKPEIGWIKIKSKPKDAPSNKTESGWIKLNKKQSNAKKSNETDRDWIKIKTKNSSTGVNKTIKTEFEWIEQETSTIHPESSWIKLSQTKSNFKLLNGTEPGWIKIKAKSNATDESRLIKLNGNKTMVKSMERHYPKLLKPQTKNTSNSKRDPTKSFEPGWLKIKTKNSDADDSNKTNKLGWIKLKPTTVESGSGLINIGQDKATPTQDDANDGNTSEWIKLKSENPESSWIKLSQKKSQKLNDTNSGWINLKPKSNGPYSHITGSGSIKLRRNKTKSRSTSIRGKNQIKWLKAENTSEQSSKSKTSPESGTKLPPNTRSNRTKPMANNSTDPNKTMPSSSSESEEDWEWVPFKIHPPNTFLTDSAADNGNSSPDTFGLTGNSNDNSDSEELIDLFPKSCSSPQRTDVTHHWLTECADCARSLTAHTFKDQLRRYSVKQFDKLFESRLKSLHQMKTLCNLTTQIMLKTCHGKYVAPKFLETAIDAFVTFVEEDFYYGMEGADPEVYPRILKALSSCLSRSEFHVFEEAELSCGLKKITGGLVLPGRVVHLKVPQDESHHSYETLIETAWKMFLNTHSYCFKDFQFPNDHHHFSILMMELFTHSMYEKWTEPPESNSLYNFILPNIQYLKETRDNIDYCVAATEAIVTDCPTWLDRDGAHKREKRRTKREKRSTTEKKQTRADTTEQVWSGEAYCLNHPKDAEKVLKIAKCQK